MTLLPILMAVHGVEDDTSLVARMQRRDPNALAELYDRYGRVTFSLIVRVVRDAGIAEDLVQETFLRVWNRVHGFDAQRGSIGPWLLAVARNRAIDYRGRRVDASAMQWNTRRRTIPSSTATWKKTF